MSLIVLCAPFEIVLAVLAPFDLMLHFGTVGFLLEYVEQLCDGIICDA